MYNMAEAEDMQLITGGVYQGKLAYAQKMCNATDKEILNCKNFTFEELNKKLFKRKNSKIKIICGLEHFSFLCVQNSIEAKELFEKNIDKFEDKCLIAADISEGVVPMEREMRDLREMNGRLLIYFAETATTVTRVFCGLPQVLKDGKASKIYLIRHGKTEGNAKKWYYGKTDLPLLDEGKKALKDMVDAGIYQSVVADYYYTSGMLRANETMNIIFGKVRREIISNLAERDFGTFEKHSHAELLSNPDYMKWITESTETENPGGVESMTQFRQRVRMGFTELLDMHLRRKNEKLEKNRNSVCVCHAGAISVIIMYLFDPGCENFYSYTPDTGRGYVIEIENGKPIGYSQL